MASDNGPLLNEARARDAWRGDEEARPEASDGHILPASEDEDEALGGKREDAIGHPEIIPPPD